MLKLTLVKIVNLPGLVDVHVHLREPGGTQKEDFETGTKAAVAGGYTQVLDMPNNIPPTITPDKLHQKEKLANGRIWCDVGFNFGASLSSIKYFKKIKNEVFALKVYMNQTTGTLLIDKFTHRDLIFKNWESERPIMVHAEGETIEVAIKLAKKYKRKLHICHVTFDQLKIIKNAKKEMDISCEVCPHHIFLSQNNLSKLGNFGVMKPPLLTETKRLKIWDNMDVIDMISTDHAPHTIDEKLDQSSPKFGVPGLETTLPLMFWAVKKRLIKEKKMIEMLSANPRKIFNLPPQKDTFVEVDLSRNYRIGLKKLFTKCGWTPFKNLEGTGEVKKVVLRGRTIFENGKFKGKPKGIVIHPNV